MVKQSQVHEVLSDHKNKNFKFRLLSHLNRLFVKQVTDRNLQFKLRYCTSTVLDGKIIGTIV